MRRQSTIPDDKSCPCFANRKSEEGWGHMIRITGQMQYRWRRFLENWWVSTTPSRRVRAVSSPRLSSSDRGKPRQRGWTHGRTPAETFQAGEIVRHLRGCSRVGTPSAPRSCLDRSGSVSTLRHLRRECPFPAGSLGALYLHRRGF
jgi:hypothetical protein